MSNRKNIYQNISKYNKCMMKKQKATDNVYIK